MFSVSMCFEEREMGGMRGRTVCMLPLPGGCAPAKSSLPLSRVP